MRTLSITLCGLMLAVAVPCFADSLDTFTVQVLEKGDGRPVPGATVVIMKHDDYLETDNNGKAVFHNVPKHMLLKILAQDYETVKVTNNGEATLTVYLPPISVEGQGVEIVADRVTEKAGKITMSVEELKHTPGAQGDPIAALKTLPGVVSSREESSDVYMRGSDVYDNATLVNRIPIGYLYHFGGFRSTINADLVSDINLFLSNAPVQYPDILGGITDVKLRAPKKDRLHGKFDISLVEAAFLLEGPAFDAKDGKTPDSFFIGGRRSYFDLILSADWFNNTFGDDDKPKEEQNQLIEVPRYYDLSAQYRHEIDNGHIDYNYFAASDSIDFDIREGSNVDPNLIGELTSGTLYQSISVSLEQQLSSRYTLSFPVVYHKDKLRINGGNSAEGAYFVNRDSNTYSLLPQITYRSSDVEEWVIGSGASYFEVPVSLHIAPPNLGKVQVPITDRIARVVDTTVYAHGSAVYLNHHYQWTPRFKSLIGVRGTYAQASGGFARSKWMPRFGMEYNVSKETLLTANYGNFAQYPIDFQLVEGFGNPNLNFNQAIHRSLGVEHKINREWDAKVEIYDKPMHDLVIALDGVEPTQYENAGEGYSYGIDVFIKRKRSEGRMGWLSYSYARTSRTNEKGEKQPFDGEQPHTLTVVWGQPFSDGPFDWMKSWKRWNWSVKMLTHTGSRYTPIIGTEQRDPADPGQGIRPVYGELNSGKLPTYFRTDLRIERDILSNTRKSKFYVEILNATNRKNIVDYDYGADLEKVDNPDIVTGLGLFPFIGYETEF